MAIILEKGGDTHRINLEKPSGRPLAGEIVINLDWNKGGFLKIYSAMQWTWILAASTKCATARRC